MPRQQPFSLQHCSVPQPKTIIHITCVPSILSRILSMCTSALLSCFIMSARINLEVSFLLRNHKMTWCWAAYWVSYGVPDKILLKFSDNILSWICICPLPKKLPHLEALYCKRYFNIYLWALKLGHAFLLDLFQALFGCLTCPDTGSGEGCSFTLGNASLNCVKKAIHTHKMCCHILK
jgi:hypothetical protein